MASAFYLDTYILTISEHLRVSEYEVMKCMSEFRSMWFVTYA